MRILVYLSCACVRVCVSKIVGRVNGNVYLLFALDDIDVRAKDKEVRTNGMTQNFFHAKITMRVCRHTLLSYRKVYIVLSSI